MKKKVFLLLLLLLVPTIVLAKDTCNDNDIRIKSIALKEVNGFSEEVQESTINNNTINLNLKMYDVGDSSTYNITIENISNEDYYFTKDSMKLENDYLEYSLKNDSETIPAKSEKAIELRVTYKNKIPNENYSDTNKLTISLSDQPLKNPKTNTNYYILLILLVILIPINIKYHKKGLLLSIFGIVSNVYAVCTFNLNIETKIEIVNKEAIFLPGEEVNVKMKELAGDDTSTVTNSYSFKDQQIASIKYSNTEPIDSKKEEKNIVSTNDSPYPIYMWYEDGTIYWWSEDIHPSLNEISNRFFYNMRILTNIDSLKNWDSSSAKDLGALLYNTDIINVDSLSNWNVANVTSLRLIFACCYSLKNVYGIKNWDVRNVVDITKIFSNCYSLEEIDLSNWKTSSLENMNNMIGMWDDTNGMPYYDSKLKTIKLSDKFDTSKVTNMYALLANNEQIEDYSFLQYIDTKNVEDIAQMFQFNMKLTDIKILKKWNVSKVKNMNGFIQHTSIESLEGLENWDVSNVTDMKFAFRDCKINSLSPIKNWSVSNVKYYNYMFSDDTYLTDTSAINDWNISNTATFFYMFRNVPNHPEFTKLQGTWSNGTFTPTA